MTERRDAPWDEQTNEVDTEQLLSEWFEADAPTREPAVLAPNVIARTALARRRSRWFVRDWWRDLFRHHQRSPLIPALGGTAVAVVALVFAIAWLLPTGVGDTETVDDPAVPADALVVSPDDSDKHATIAEAIAAAEEGDTVAILPGRYVENLVIDKDITLLGAGERDVIVLEPSDPGEPVLTIDGGDATLSGFTITGPGSSVTVVASAPTIENMVLREVGDQWWTWTGAGWDGFDEAAPSILVELFGEVTILDSLFDGGGEIEVRDSSTAQILDNEFINGAAIFLNDATADTVVRGNTITDSGLFSIEITSRSDLLVEDNVISQSDPGIGIQALGLTGTIRNNEIRGSNVGIQLLEGASPTITDNVIDAVGAAFEIHDVSEAVISGNELCGGNAIISLLRDAIAPDVSDNTICEEVPLVYER